MSNLANIVSMCEYENASFDDSLWQCCADIVCFMMFGTMRTSTERLLTLDSVTFAVMSADSDQISVGRKLKGQRDFSC